MRRRDRDFERDLRDFEVVVVVGERERRDVDDDFCVCGCGDFDLDFFPKRLVDGDLERDLRGGIFS